MSSIPSRHFSKIVIYVFYRHNSKQFEQAIDYSNKKSKKIIMRHSNEYENRGFFLIAIRINKESFSSFEIEGICLLMNNKT